MEQRRFYVHPERRDFIFLEWNSDKAGWMPSIHAMEDWQHGLNRIYSPEENPSVLVTMPGHVVWPRLLQGTHIRGILAPPWIQDQYTTGIPESDIDVIDAILVEQMDSPPILTQDQMATFDRLYRPRLHNPLEQAIAASLSNSRTKGKGSKGSKSPPPFPAHLVGPVLAAAEAEGKTCSITMEPIRKQKASITSCGHIFQTEAIREWLKDHDTCPECRVHCSPRLK